VRRRSDQFPTGTPGPLLAAGARAPPGRRANGRQDSGLALAHRLHACVAAATNDGKGGAMVRAIERGGRSSAGTLGVAVLVLVAGLASAAIGGLPERGSWFDAIEAADRALARGDVSRAERALREAYTAALSSRTWRGMVDVGDAYRRLADAAGVRRWSEAHAHDIYLAALFRARQQGSLPGVFRAAEGLAALGDRQGVNTSIAVAKGLAGRVTDVQERGRAQASVERLARRLLALDVGTGR
jgi:hypothetical protein